MEERINRAVAYIRDRLAADPELDLVDGPVIDEATNKFAASTDNHYWFNVALFDAFF